MTTRTYPNFDDKTDFSNAEKGFIRALKPCKIYSSVEPKDRVVWDNDKYSFLEGDCPEGLANKSLWRQGQLCYKQGLFQVNEKPYPGDKYIYQVRGLDIANMTFVESDNGVIIIDPLTAFECAREAMKLYQEHRPNTKVTGLIYTHSHGDHFGGARAVLPENWDPEKLPIIAPEGFLDHAVSEMVYAGNAMTRRAVYFMGEGIPKEPAGQIGCGLGQAACSGVSEIIAPTQIITMPHEEVTVDGVLITFQLTPNTEAPAEMNFHFPQYKALCMAENANHTLHNIQTLRGALVRDARNWSRYMNEAIVRFGGDATDIVFSSHHWPTWESQAILEFLSQQRDLYAYLHDQTLRLLNDGKTGIEIAEEFQLPTKLDLCWHARGYYGSVSHNVKAIYNRYMGWYDGNPAHLWEHPPVQAGKRYVDCMGGITSVIDKAKRFKADGDFRFAATLLSHAVFADQNNTAAKEELALVFEQLAYGAENGIWRNFYLTGAAELRGPIQPAVLKISPESLVALELQQVADTVAIRVDGLAAQHESFTIEMNISDTHIGWPKGYLMTMSNGALTHHEVKCRDPPPEAGETTASLTFWASREQLAKIVAESKADIDSLGITYVGEKNYLEILFSYVLEPDSGFAIVTPEKVALT